MRRPPPAAVRIRPVPRSPMAGSASAASRSATPRSSGIPRGKAYSTVVCQKARPPTFTPFSSGPIPR